jgi:hypothetical protein
MVFYLSLCDQDDQDRFATATESAQPRLAAPAADLRSAIHGSTPGHPFTGWNDQPHPLLSR